MQDIVGLAFLFLAIGFYVMLFSYYPKDPGFAVATTNEGSVQNNLGLVGSYIASGFVLLFGLGSFMFPVGFIAFGFSCFSPRYNPAWWRWFGLFLFALCLMPFASSALGLKFLSIGYISGGGIVGEMLYQLALRFFRPVGAGIVLVFLFITSFQLIFGLTWVAIYKYLRNSSILLRHWIKNRGQQRKKSPKQRLSKAEVKNTTPGQALSEGISRPGPHKEEKKKSPVPSPGPPPIEFLKLPETEAQHIPKPLLEDQGRDLEDCLSNFGIQGEVQGATPGPVITMFEVKPAPGVKISRIAGLSDDLALALRASAVRIEAPLAGRDTVGIEIPNKTRQTVYLREIMQSRAFQNSDSVLTLALGKDIYGNPHVSDLAKMPHLLVAGATGQGKSVCINSLLMSFLYKASPDMVRLLLVDPKRIELAVYSKLPHLVHPVVTDMTLAKNALEWAVYEMEQRYDAMARLGVRNIDGYNSKLAELDKDIPEELKDLTKLPYLVIVIDELADLMLTARKEVETSIVRLAQLARAAGIHMILATQRPSVDVVTGLIKANFPSRIAFTVTSPQDSRTILDTVGANHLLGRGDMLFKPGGGKNIRLHGALVDEEEIAKVTGYWQNQEAENLDLDFSTWTREEEKGPGGSGAEGQGSGIPDDPVYAEAVEFVMEQGKASISLIQRRFRIGFNRAARYVEQMEQDGIVGAADGAKPRKVIIRD